MVLVVATLEPFFLASAKPYSQRKKVMINKLLTIGNLRLQSKRATLNFKIGHRGQNVSV
jgi:hypothetical protein